MPKDQPKSNYRKQLIGVGILVGLLVIGAVFAGIMFAVSNQSVDRGEDAVSQLAERMDRAFPLLQVVGAFDRDAGVEIIFYESEPARVWTESEKLQMDTAMLMAMEYTAERGKTLTAYILTKNTLVALDAQEVDVFFAAAVFQCTNVSGLQDVNYNTADHEDIIKNCRIYPGGQYWGEAEAILWPPER